MLIERFERKSKERTEAAIEEWKEIHIAIGIARYDKNIDKTVGDVIRRADKLMYKNKRERRSSQ